jgi:hypothetical protein
MSHHLTDANRACIGACNDCATECGNCFTHMIGKESPNDCPACCIECSALCRLCADAMARNSPFLRETCALCARVCDWCAEQMRRARDGTLPPMCRCLPTMCAGVSFYHRMIGDGRFVLARSGHHVRDPFR